MCLLALEREQLVSYAYREDVLGRRLASCRGEPAARALLRYALLQVWRDEEAHTVFVRSELVADEPARTGSVLAEQAAGLLAGWSSALKHHVPRSQAPLRSCLVDGLAVGARLAGKLSPDLRAELAYKTFRSYCLYNVDAEETAALCWRRLVDLDRRLGYGNESVFARIAAEEAVHGRVFALIARSLDEHDAIRPEATVTALRDELAAIEPRLVAPELRSGVASRPPGMRGRPEAIGHGGEVHVLDQRTGDKRAATAELLRRLGLGDVAGRTVAVKASWMLGYSRRDPSSITDPTLLHQLVDELDAAGAAQVVLLDGSNLYSNLYRGRSVTEVADHFAVPRWPATVEDAAADVVALTCTAPFGPAAINRRWRDADIRISVTRLRSHPTEHVHLTTANLEGLIEDSCQNIFWNRSYDYSAAAVAAGLEAPPTLAIVDAWDDCPDGWFGIMAGPRPRHPNRLYGGTDALAVDLTALAHTGSSSSVESPTLRRAIEAFGDPRPATIVRGPDTPIEGWRNPYRTRLSGALADVSYPVYRWLSRGGAVFTPPMDPAFTEIAPLPIGLRVLRRVARRALGVRPPATPSTPGSVGAAPGDS